MSYYIVFLGPPGQDQTYLSAAGTWLPIERWRARKRFNKDDADKQVEALKAQWNRPGLRPLVFGVMEIAGTETAEDTA